MSFLYPQFIYALGLLAIPVVIHFFNFRRYKKVEFTNVRLLQKAQNVKRSINQLRNWLVLLLRMLAITAVVLAFAQPVSNEFLESKGKARSVTIYVDNSSSTLLKNSEGNVFEQEKQKADQIASVFGKDDDYMFVNNNSSQRTVYFNKQDFLELNGRQEISPITKTLPEVWERFEELKKQNQVAVNHLYLISDFQKNTVQLNDFEPDSLTKVHLVPVQASNINNLSIDSAWTELAAVRQGEVMSIRALVRNHGQDALDQASIRLYCNKEQKAIADFAIEGSSTETIELTYKVNEPGWNRIEMQIEDYPVDFDNSYYLTYHVKTKVRVLAINFKSESRFFKTALSTDPVFDFRNVSLNSIDYSQLGSYDLIILNEVEDPASGLVQQLSDVLANGTSVFILPGDEVNLTSFNREFARLGYTVTTKEAGDIQVKKLAVGDPFLKNIFSEEPKNSSLPQVHQRYVFSCNAPDFADIMAFGNGSPFLTKAQSGKAFCYMMASNLSEEWTDFGAKSPLFLPIIYKMALHKTGGELLSHFIDNSSFVLPVNLESADDVLSFTLDDLNFIPQQQNVGAGVRIFLTEQFERAGFYKISTNRSDSAVAYVGLNFSRKESNMEFIPIDELRFWAKEHGIDVLNAEQGDFKSAVIESNEQNLWWKWLLYAALAFVFLEILTIKVFGYATRA